MDRQQLSRDLQEGTSDDLRRRRAIIAISLAGMVSMSAVSLYQTGMLKQLPDLPLPGFDSEEVAGSPAAYWWGAAEGTWAVLGCALNLPLATFGGMERARSQPLVPLLAGAKGIVDAGIATWYVHRMATRHRKWCSLCLVGALADVLVFGLTLPEARKALATLRHT
ncbi:MAG TPA: vitamin K epoxide reductase family protein [Herpetosiphonaceae bacterium]|nr:vitamin K epoxide reductase family protein [Herpetosiphonaceae bacterium]